MPSQARADKTRRQILEAARVCLSRSGYDAASVSDICQEAGVTKGAFYYHFESKQNLFLELFTLWEREFSTVLSLFDETSRTAKERLLALQIFAREVFTGTSNYMPLIFEFWLQSTRNPLVQKISLEAHRRHVEMLSRLMLEGQVDGSIKIEDPFRTSQMLFGMVIGMIMLALVDPESTDWGNDIHESITVFIQRLILSESSANSGLST